MKYFTCLLSLLIGTLMGCYPAYAGISKSDVTCYSFIKQFAKKVKTRYGVTLSSIGGGEDKGTWLMSANFHRKGAPLTKEKARELIIAFSEEFLSDINSDKNIRPFLKYFPFTSKNIDLGIINFDSEGKDIYHPYIAVVSSEKGKVFYCTEDPENEIGYKSQEGETYEEALEKLK